MFAKKIVVAYNDTDLSNDLLDYVHDILKLDPEIELNIVYSYEAPPQRMNSFNQSYEFGKEEMEEQASKIISKGEGKFADLPNPVVGFICQASPASAILDHAEKNKADLIVMGNRGFTGLREFVSSVSRTVQSKSHIPVLTFPKYEQD